MAVAKKQPAKKPSSKKPAPAGDLSALPVPAQLAATLAALAQLGSEPGRASLVRFGIDAPSAFGVAMNELHTLAKRLGRSHALAEALWATGRYEARLLTAFVDEPDRVTPAQMERWCRDFDNWGVCDTLCFHLFDRTPHAWAKLGPWCARPGEFQRRAGFALLACLAGHDRTASDAAFLDALPLIERGATDPRNFVKKGVSWALRRIGTRNPALRAAALAVAHRLSATPDPAARWVGKDALRDLTRPPRAR